MSFESKYLKYKSKYLSYKAKYQDNNSLAGGSSESISTLKKYTYSVSDHKFIETTNESTIDPE